LAMAVTAQAPIIVKLPAGVTTYSNSDAVKLFKKARAIVQAAVAATKFNQGKGAGTISEEKVVPRPISGSCNVDSENLSLTPFLIEV